MKLSVYVLGKEIAVLESVGDFKSVLTYSPNVAPDDFVSLTMPVQTESHVWDDQLPPIFQMNLPEGYSRNSSDRTSGLTPLHCSL
jgi:serine/threonine-protein kinase HipA